MARLNFSKKTTNGAVLPFKARSGAFCLNMKGRGQIFLQGFLALILQICNMRDGTVMVFTG